MSDPKREYEELLNRRREQLAQGLAKVTAIEDPVGSAKEIESFVEREYERFGARRPEFEDSER